MNELPLGLETELGENGVRISGGQKQRLILARALIRKPEFLLLDEATSALDNETERFIQNTITDLVHTMTIVVVAHRLSTIRRADIIFVMEEGKVVESGPVADVLDNPSHPYTMGLYNAFPELAGEDRELSPIEGSPPDLLNPPKGCRFRARCPFALDACAEDPVEHIVGEGHLAYCHRATEAKDLRETAKRTATWVGVTSE